MYNTDDFGDISRSLIRLFHIKFLVNCVLYAKSYYRVPKEIIHQLSIGATFDDLEGHSKVISVRLSRRASLSNS